MKKVWILEMFQTREEMERVLSDLENDYEACKADLDEEGTATMDKIITNYKKTMQDNPNGYWKGIAGRSIYRQFCDTAKETLMRYPRDTKFRVVEGEIKDDAKYWLGYKFVKENEGVMKYLYATT